MDKYTKYARVYPAIVGMILPFILTILLLGNNFPNFTDTLNQIISVGGMFLSVAVVYTALGYFIREMCRSISKWLFQFPLFKEDETQMPSTKFLLWSNHLISEEYHQRISEKLAMMFNIHLLTEQEESNNRKEAELRIINAVQCMRQATRKDPILLQYNYEFGFCRNYLGASCISLILLIAILTISQVWSLMPLWIPLTMIILQLLLATFFFISLKYRGNAYAKQLFASYLASEYLA